MGRGRAPCCAKVGLNKGSWTPEEDMRLIAYIHKYGHGNWRALPKLAGLLRCGKSCRLRWINYLRPDIKRGNFTKEEEDTVIKLHGLLGNKWSKIASCLPGRTDNEIKNVWNTHLKKRLAAQKDEPKRPSEEQPSSPSSITTASVSCSDEGESKATEKERTEANVEANNDDEAMDGEEIDKIEIPIEPNLDFWDVMQDSCLSEPAAPQGMAADEPLVDLIEPELLDMLNDGINIAPATTVQTTTAASTTSDDHPNAESDVGDEHDKWLAYLEKELELDLWGENTTTATAAATITTDIMEGGDPVATYFQALQSSTSPLDPLLY